MPKWSRLLCLIVLVGILSGCVVRERTPQVLPEWGRAARVGTASRSTPPALGLTSAGELLLAWPRRPEGASEDRLHVLLIDALGNTLADRDVTPPVTYLRQVQLLIDAQGALHLVWSAGPLEERSLWYAALSSAADLQDPALPLLEAQQISSAEGVSWFKSILHPSGRVILFWLDNHGNLFGRWVDVEATTQLASDLLAADLWVDVAGDVHCTWGARASLTSLTLSYARLDLASWELAPAHAVASLRLPGGSSPDSVDGPLIVVEGDLAYVTWTQRGNSTAGLNELYGVVFPLADPAASRPLPGLVLPPDYPADAAPADGAFAYQSLARMSDRATGAPLRHAARALRVFNGETVMALSARYNTRSRAVYQPTLLYLRDGEALGYQAPTWTQSASVNVVLEVTSDGHLYLVWMDQIGEAFEYPIYLASTVPEVHAVWQQLTFKDYVVILADAVNSMAFAIFMFPLMLIWFVCPLIWLFVTLLRGNPYGLRGRRILLGALWLHWASKYLFVYQILTYIPRLSYLSPAVGTLLIYLVPLLTLGVGVLMVGGFYRLRRDKFEFSALRHYIFIALIDMVLSLGVYGIGFYE